MQVREFGERASTRRALACNCAAERAGLRARFATLRTAEARRQARCARTVQISVRRCEIVDDPADLLLVDRRAVDLDHLGHFRLPKVLFEFLPARLRSDVVSGM